MSYHAKFILAAIAVIALFLGASEGCIAQRKVTTGSEGEAVYKYDTPGTRLEGTLVEHKVYGPPGYGETPAKDARSTILVLKLLYAISVEPAGNADASKSANLDPARHVREVQLFVSRSKAADARKLVGRIVTATGTPNESVTASQYTKVWVDVETLVTKQ